MTLAPLKRCLPAPAVLVSPVTAALDAIAPENLGMLQLLRARLLMRVILILMGCHPNQQEQQRIRPPAPCKRGEQQQFVNSIMTQAYFARNARKQHNQGPGPVSFALGHQSGNTTSFDRK